MYGGQHNQHARDVAYGHDDHEQDHDETPDPRFPHFSAEVKDSQGNIHHKRTAQLGVYECMNQNWVAPCIWTPLTDGACHNR